MWNEGENWRPWDNHDLNYRPVRSRERRGGFGFGPRSNSLSSLSSSLLPPGSRSRPFLQYDFNSSDQGFFNGPVYSGYPEPPNNFMKNDPGFCSMNPVDRRSFEYNNQFSRSSPAGISHIPYSLTPPQPETITFLNLKTATECGVKWQIPINYYGKFWFPYMDFYCSCIKFDFLYIKFDFPYINFHFYQLVLIFTPHLLNFRSKRLRTFSKAVLW